MQKLILTSGITLVTMLFVTVGCATSRTPSQFLDEFPEQTNSDFYDRLSGNTVVSNDKCKLLVKGRKYASPIGFTVNNDMKNGAKGIDEWVQADGGNAYILNSFEWVSVDDNGSTQLIIYFDTLLCE